LLREKGHNGHIDNRELASYKAPISASERSISDRLARQINKRSID